MKCRYPPYDRRARERLGAAMRSRIAAFGTLIVHTGTHAWDICRDDPRAAVLLPPGEAPEAFDWGLASLTTPPWKSVIVLDHGNTTGDILARLGRALVKSGAGHVAILPKGGRVAFFKPAEVAHAA